MARKTIIIDQFDKIIGERIENVRKARKISRAELASKLS